MRNSLIFVKEASMNKILADAVTELARLPEAEQEAYGLHLLEIMADERGWDDRFAGSQDLLGRMAADAQADAHRGSVFDHDPSDLPA